MNTFNISYTLETGGARKQACNISAENYEIAKTHIVNYWLKKPTPMFADDFKFEGEFNGQQRIK